MKNKLHKVEPFLYLLPALIGILVFTLYPVINVFIMSFKENYQHIDQSFTGYGIDNYLILFKDPYFYQAFLNTFKYVLLVVPISTVLALLIANLLNQNIKCKALFQTAFFLPMVTSVTAIGLAWKFMFNYQSGIINYILSFFGVEAINWLQDPNMNLFALVIYGIWSILPFSIIIILSGLQNIDPLYYTAAKVDGASTMKLFTRITVPLVKSTLSLLVIINTISTFKVFNELFPLFSGPGISYNLFTVVYYIYHQFRGLMPPMYAVSAAGAVILFFVILIFTAIQLKIQKKGES